MGVYNITSDNIFLFGRSESQILIREIKGDLLSRDFGPSSWKEVAKVGVTADSNYNELGIYDFVIRGQQLKDLAFDLWKSRLHVNRQGHCFIGKGFHSITAFGLERFRLNDLFGWSKYGVNVPTSSFSSTIWDRRDMYTGKQVIINPTEQLQKLLDDCKSEVKDYELRMKGMEKELDLCKKLLQDRDNELKAKVNDLLLSQKLVQDKNKETIELALVLTGLQDQKDGKLKESESRLKGKEKELKDCELQLREKEEKLSLCKRSLEEKDRILNNGWAAQMEEKEKELSVCNKRLADKEKQVNGLKIALNSLVNSLWLLNTSLQKEVDHDHHHLLRIN